VYNGGAPKFKAKIAEVADQGYEGIEFTSARSPAFAT
jgi:hypothetical protein